MVVRDRREYIDKAINLLAHPAYRTIGRDPTNKLKAKLITILRRIKRESGLEDNIYKYMYPMSCTCPNFHGLQKIHKSNTPSGLYYRVSVTYGAAKVLAKILKPLMGKSPHHIQSTKDFVDRVSKVTLHPGECLCSYDFTALFTSVPVDPATYIIMDLLEQDTTLCDKTVLSVHSIIVLLGFFLHNTYFSFQNKFYEQVEGAAMGSLVSLIVVNLHMEQFEKKALSTTSTPPGCG